MTVATILLADNDFNFLKTRLEFLEQEGYQVFPAANPTEARRALERGGIDVAILDIRLRDDDDEKDISGLTIAAEIARSVPKIMLTGFPSVEAVRTVLRPQEDGLASATDFIAKSEGPEELLRAVRRILRTHPRGTAGKLQYNLAAIFGLITEAFTARDLRRFCRERDSFRPVLSDVSPESSLTELGDALVEFCEKKVLLSELLAEIQAVNPRQFEEFRSDLYMES
jgi:DNA-binding response OmpR family regulator